MAIAGRASERASYGIKAGPARLVDDTEHQRVVIRVGDCGRKTVCAVLCHGSDRRTGNGRCVIDVGHFNIKTGQTGAGHTIADTDNNPVGNSHIAVAGYASEYASCDIKAGPARLFADAERQCVVIRITGCWRKAVCAILSHGSSGRTGNSRCLIGVIAIVKIKLIGLIVISGY